MDIEQIRDYCLLKKEVTEDTPFGHGTLVFKVSGKIFLLLSLDSEELRFNVKCDPDKAIELREEFFCVLPGYHMNKKYWNTIIVDGSIPSSKLKEWIDHSYHEVVQSLPKKLRAGLGH